jgi:hypothetical protein
LARPYITWAFAGFLYIQGPYKYMNYILLFCIIVSMIGGVLRGLNDMREVRNNPSLGVKESKNLFSFLFTDRY